MLKNAILSGENVTVNHFVSLNVFFCRNFFDVVEEIFNIIVFLIC